MGFASWLRLYFAQSEVQDLVHKVMLEKKAVTRTDEMKANKHGSDVFYIC